MGRRSKGKKKSSEKCSESSDTLDCGEEICEDIHDSSNRSEAKISETDVAKNRVINPKAASGAQLAR
ncbi:unnamed protein product [Strongylus vulgaris]|uniref:Uncharacterized protein n=1 Tax=Strongylus vulgaris TaxID=40348 RepID=A0A3P7J8Q0_STRVU|nr:unnamed protein product [Strongylus vulgaris]